MLLGDVQRGEGGEGGGGTLFTIYCTFLETAKQEHVLSVFSVLSIKVMLTFARTKFNKDIRPLRAYKMTQTIWCDTNITPYSQQAHCKLFKGQIYTLM